MTFRSHGGALGLALALFSGPAWAAPSATPSATTLPKAFVAPPALGPGSARDLYSPQARRLVRTYLRLQLLELQKADLERVRAVIEGKLGLDGLLAAPATQAGNQAVGR